MGQETMAEIYHVDNRESLAFLIQSVPLDTTSIIILNNRTKYTLRAVIDENGKEMHRHGWENSRGKWIDRFEDDESHKLYQTQRRAKLAGRIRRMAVRYFK